MKLTKLHPKELIGVGFEALIAVVVAAFLALNSFRFWEWTFPPEQWYFAYLGFGLTGGAAIGYLVIFLWRAHTSLRQTISLVMLIICIIGELLTAGFGIQVEIWKKAGYVLTQDNFNFMTMVVQILGFIHSVAILAYYAGDRIAEMFGDDDRDGIPNYRDKDYKKGSNQRPAYAKDTPQQQQAPQHTLDEFLKVTGMTKEQARAKYADRDAFMSFASGQFDYVSGGNMKRMHGELMNGQGNPTPAARQGRS